MWSQWALESITTNKASGGDGIPVELFQILKDDAGKVLHSICQQIWKTQQWLKDWKRAVFIPIPKKGNAKECSNYCTIVLISHASKVMLKILQASFTNTWTMNFQTVKLDLEKAEEPKIKLPTSIGSSKKQDSSRKSSTSALLIMSKSFVWITKSWKILKEMGIPDHLTCLLRNLYAGQEATVRTRHGKIDWFKLGKGYVKAVYCYPAYLTSMQSTSWETLGWKKHKLESRLLGEISITSDMQMGEGNGNPLQYSCLENPMDRGAW